MNRANVRTRAGRRAAAILIRMTADDARRLACFDRETARFPMTREEGFGLTSPTLGAPPAPAKPAAQETLTARVVGLQDRAHAGFVATLDNGQVWAQNEMDTHRGIRTGDTVTLKVARMGGYWMVGPDGWSTKVRRIR